MSKILEEIEGLKSQLTGDMFNDMDVQDEIYRLKRIVAKEKEPLPERPDDQDIECFNCGS